MKGNQPDAGTPDCSSLPVPYLDGVRGLAILLVGLGHIFYDYYIFKIGWVGLNLFFVLSGYLITQRLFHFKGFSIRNYFRNFYARRVLRIFPLYYMVLLVFLVVLPGLFDRFQHHYAELSAIQLTYWSYTSNWHIISNGLPGQPVFFHFWSLAVEEQFYLVWPILFVLFSGIRARYFLVVAIIGLSIILRITETNSLHAYVNTLTAAEPLLLGCLISMVRHHGYLKKIWNWLVCGAILSAITLTVIFLLDGNLHITNEPLMKYGYSAINVIMAFIVCTLLTGNPIGLKLRAVFSFGWLKWLGKYSYAIYVFHWIVLQTLIFKIDYFLRGLGVPELASYLLTRVGGILFILVISYCSYHFFEKYFIGLKRYFSQDRDWKWAGMGIPNFIRAKRKLAGN